SNSLPIISLTCLWMLAADRPSAPASCEIVRGSCAARFRISSLVPLFSSLFLATAAHGSLYPPRRAETHSQAKRKPLKPFRTPLRHVITFLFLERMLNLILVKKLKLLPLN